jgi:hypothetical protein
MYWFPSAFSWEYPDAPEGLPTAGIASRGFSSGLDEVEEFHKIAAALDVPEDTRRCSDSTRFDDDDCSNAFFDAWHFHGSTFGGSPWIRYLISILGLVLVAYLLFQEWAIKKKPHWMKCRCLVLKSLCPSPKGTREEVERAPEHVWDKVRLCWWAVTVLYFITPCIYASVIARRFLDRVRIFNDRLPEGLDMNARLGPASEAVTWAAVATCLVSCLCILAKWIMTRKGQRGNSHKAAKSPLPRVEESSYFVPHATR